MLTFRYFLRLVSAFTVRFKGIILLGIILGVILFLFLNVFGTSLLSRTTESIGMVGRYGADNLPDDVLHLIGNGLTKINADGTVSPDLAASWETSDKGQTWIFTLKDGLTWQDGKKVTAQSINYQFSDAQIEKPNEKTLVFKLQSPFAPLPYVVARPVFKKGLLGTGEWRVTKATLSAGFIQKLILVNKKGDKKIIKFYPTEDRAKLGFKLGEIDSLLGIFDSKPFDSWKVTDIGQDINPHRYVAVFFNTQDKLTGEKSFRQALAYAIDKERFDGPRALSPISPNSWAYNPQVKPYTFDLDRAKELVDELPNELKENLSVNLATTPVLLSTAEAIAKDWGSAGVKTSVQVTSGIPSDYQAFLAIFDIPHDPDQYALWHSTQTGTNISRYSNPRIDKLLEDGRVELNLEERRKIYLDFQRFLVEDSPAIFLYHPVLYEISRR